MNFPLGSQYAKRGQEPEQAGILVVGYGNMQNRDDGIGPFVVERLAGVLHVADAFRFLTLPRLSPAFAMELQYASGVIFVVATEDVLAGGWHCKEVLPEPHVSTVKTNCLNPESLLGLTRSLYNKQPPAWVFLVQGERFGIGSGITPAARKRIDKAFLLIVETILDIHSKIV